MFDKVVLGLNVFCMCLLLRDKPDAWLHSLNGVAVGWLAGAVLVSVLSKRRRDDDD